MQTPLPAWLRNISLHRTIVAAITNHLSRRVRTDRAIPTGITGAHGLSKTGAVTIEARRTWSGCGTAVGTEFAGLAFTAVETGLCWEELKNGFMIKLDFIVSDKKIWEDDMLLLFWEFMTGA